MPSLRQLEFTFRSTDILSVGPPGVSPGELITEGSPQHVRDDPKVIAAYLGADEEEAIAVMESGT